MKRYVFVLVIFSGILNVQRIYGTELKDFDWETGFSSRINVKKDLSGQAVVRTNGEKYLWGGNISGKITKEKIPSDIKAGNLNYVGVISFLNNPVLSSVISPFSIPQASIQNISARLPDGSTWNKPISAFMKISDFSLFYTEENVTGFSKSIRKDFGKRKGEKSFDFLGAFVSSPQYAKKNDSWYSERPFQKEFFRTASMVFQGLYKHGNMVFLLSDGIFFQSDGKVFHAFRTENCFGPVSVSLFVNLNKNLMTASGKELDELYQIKANVQGTSETGRIMPFFWKYGFTFLGNVNPREKEILMKGSAGLRILCFLTSINLSLSGEFVLPYDEKNIMSPKIDKIGISLKNGWYFSFAQPVFRCNFVFIPKEDFSSYQAVENMGLSINISSKPSLYINLSSELKQKNGLWQSGNCDLGLSMKYRHRLLDVSGKVSWSIEF